MHRDMQQNPLAAFLDCKTDAKGHTSDAQTIIVEHRWINRLVLEDSRRKSSLHNS